LPFLVDHALIAPEWALVADPSLGWGRAVGDNPAPPSDATTNELVAALREEIRTERTSDQLLARFIADAASLEQTYNGMIETLEQRGTKVVRFGRDDPAELVAAFADVGLRLVGPSPEQLVACADLIAKTTQDSVQRVSDFAAHTDALVGETEAYRALTADGLRSDAVDALSRPGPAINLQSIVTGFDYEGTKLLFAGDMQFASTQVGDQIVQGEVAKLRARIADGAPYDLVKLSHHGSDNALDAEVLGELGETKLYGICAGEQSSAHPNPEVLRLLDSHKDRLEWVRTDHNGLVSVEFTDPPKVTLTRGEINDPRPNTSDLKSAVGEGSASAGEAMSRRAPPAPSAAKVTARTPTRPSGDVEIVTRIPPGVRALTLKVEVEDSAARGTSASSTDVPSDQAAELVIAGGRQLPQLLFVTDGDGLARNIGRGEAEQAISTLRASGFDVLDHLGTQADDVAGAVSTVRELLAAKPEIAGVVVLGGYDIVPAQRLDSLPPDLRQRIGRTDDFDDFIVWSDDAYGDRDGDQIAELPVSRIPDGKSAPLVFAALAAANQPRPRPRVGVRNIARPFAEGIYASIPGSDPLAVSAPTTFQAAPRLDGEAVYLMLHGNFDDSTSFWGENTPPHEAAVNLSNIPDPAGRVVLAGCCWGALTVEPRAMLAGAGITPAPKVVDASIALTFLKRGATAFVGCTGSHYSPVEQPYGYFGGPMHEAFWRAVSGGVAPAQALYQAKIEFVAGFPHGLADPVEKAIEYKTLHQFTCLGLGW
jgi:hypothetical protein